MLLRSGVITRFAAELRRSIVREYTLAAPSASRVLCAARVVPWMYLFIVAENRSTSVSVSRISAIISPSYLGS